MQKVAFDSSFLMAVVEHPTTWFEDLTEQLGRFEPVLLDCVAQELRKLSVRGERRGRFAALALEMSSSFKAAKCGSAEVDSELASFAEESGAVVATVDADLQAMLRARRIRVASLRRNRVALV